MRRETGGKEQEQETGARDLSNQNKTRMARGSLIFPLSHSTSFSAVVSFFQLKHRRVTAAHRRGKEGFAGQLWFKISLPEAALRLDNFGITPKAKGGGGWRVCRGGARAGVCAPAHLCCLRLEKEAGNRNAIVLGVI